MRSFAPLTTAFAFALATTVSAQSWALGGPGRFLCSTIDPVSGSAIPNASVCTFGAMSANQACPPPPTLIGLVDGGFKNNGAVPSIAACVEDAISGNYYCGYTGAACVNDTQCDNGSCVGNVCTGGLGTPCTKDSTCLGNLYCLSPAAESTGFCGGTGDSSGNGALCNDGNCSVDTGSCIPPPPVLGGASQRSRARRHEALARGAVAARKTAHCPASQTACAIPGSLRGFECIDTSTSLEQCGACAGFGGTDCTSLPGVESVGCVDGTCEIWACEVVSTSYLLKCDPGLY
ncbi:hypothetical protein RQP46_005006 [Phenoliferia psychrophenolica]